MNARQNEIIEKIREGTASPDDTAELYKSIRGFCVKVAKRYESLLRTSGEMDDLLQEAYLATVEAAKAYDPEAGASFLSWLSFYLNRYYENYCGQQTGGSAGTVQRARRIRRWEVRFMAELNRAPTDEEICRHFQITQETLRILRQRGKEISIDAPVAGADELTVGDTIPDKNDLEEMVLDRIQRTEVREILRGYISDLPADQRAAVIKFYLIGNTDERGAAAMDLTENKFRSLRLAGLKQLRSRKHIEELGRYLPERLGSLPYKSVNRRKFQSSTEAAVFHNLHLQNWREAYRIKDDALHEIKGGKNDSNTKNRTGNGGME